MRKIKSVKNCGMSLVELLVSVAVLAIAMVGILALINLSTRYYSHSSREVEVQSELQTTFAMVSNMLVDANVSVSFSTSDKTAQITNSSKKFVVKLVGKKLYAKEFSPASTAYTGIEDAANLLADHVDFFAIDTSHYYDGFVTMGMRVSYGNREASMTKNVFLRNSETDAGSFYSECTIVKSDSKAEFTLTRATGAETIVADTPITIRVWLSIGAYDVGTISGTRLTIVNSSYNKVTGLLTIQCKTTEAWSDTGSVALLIKKKQGTTESDITGDNALIIGISK